VFPLEFILIVVIYILQQLNNIYGFVLLFQLFFFSKIIHGRMLACYLLDIG